MLSLKKYAEYALPLCWWEHCALSHQCCLASTNSSKPTHKWTSSFPHSPSPISSNTDTKTWTCALGKHKCAQKWFIYAHLVKPHHCCILNANYTQLFAHWIPPSILIFRSLAIRVHCSVFRAKKALNLCFWGYVWKQNPCLCWDFNKAIWLSVCESRERQWDPVHSLHYRFAHTS